MKRLTRSSTAIEKRCKRSVAATSVVPAANAPTISCSSKVQKPHTDNGEAYLWCVALDRPGFTVLGETTGDGERPPLKIAELQIYDKDGNLVPLTLIADESCWANGQKFYFCGIVLSCLEESADCDTRDGVPIMDVEMVEAPWLTGFGEDDKLAVGVSSADFDFYILGAHDIYKPIFSEYVQKCTITKRVADFLIKFIDVPLVEYEELLAYLSSPDPPSKEIDLETLVANLDFVKQHLLQYDGARDPDETSIFDNGCFRDLCKFDGHEFVIPEQIKGPQRTHGRRKRPQMTEPTKAVVTPTVAKVFEDCRPFDYAIDLSHAAVTNNVLQSTKRKSKLRISRVANKESAVVTLDLEATGSGDGEEDDPKFNNEVYSVGDGVFLSAGQLEFAYKKPSPTIKTDDDYDGDMFPEKWRKRTDGARTSRQPKPFCVGQIIEFIEKRDGKRSRSSVKDVRVLLRLFYRPEDTSMKAVDAKKLDLNVLFFSEETAEVSIRDVVGRCTVLPKKFIESRISLEEYYSGGSNRFYFEKMFDAVSAKFSTTIPPCTAVESAKKKIDDMLKETAYPSGQKPLNIMDLFAGCGGMSEGLHQSGVGVTKWAIEIDSSASRAFQLNFPGAVMFNSDCNVLLKEALENPAKAKLPQKHEVDMIIGGPPCQGFCGMNRFRTGKASAYKNSLIVTFLSYVEYYQPRFVIMENVKQLFSFHDGDVLRRIIKCYQEMGYQSRYEVVSAGGFGIPQQRNRAIIIAAKHGEVLPEFPTPTHAFFSKSKKEADARIGAPLRMVTVWDGISDLREIAADERSSYTEPAKSQYQRLARKGNTILFDHVVRQPSALNEQRIKRIPKTPGSDWRDLPNLEIKSSGIHFPKLVYVDGQEAVCPCGIDEASDCVRQEDTLIPWCLPHTADRHNQWRGLFGRLDYDGVFATTLTNPEPMGKQGRVLHPEEDRLYSVREAARSQGFPDQFRFVGSITDRYRQVGNAVPPPLALALGRQIVASLAKKNI